MSKPDVMRSLLEQTSDFMRVVGAKARNECAEAVRSDDLVAAEAWRAIASGAQTISTECWNLIDGMGGENGRRTETDFG